MCSSDLYLGSNFSKWECEENKRRSQYLFFKVCEVASRGTLLAPPKIIQNPFQNPSQKEASLEVHQFAPASALIAGCLWGRGGVT